MNTTRHGLSIGIERVNNHFFLTLKGIGKLEHDDYEVIVPMIESALKGVKDPKIKALIDCSEFSGWEMRAAWDDFKLGLKHGSKFLKVAILGNQRWLQLGAKISDWFIAGEVQYFEDVDQAYAWLKD